MASVESEFDVEKDLPEFLSSVLDRTDRTGRVLLGSTVSTATG